MGNNINIINELINYYKEKGLVIVGLNDSQGVNTTSFLKKGLLDYLADTLTSKELTPEVINAFSLLINKTEHIDYILKNNLSLEEIKLSQVYSVESAFSKVMSDIKLPEFLGKVGRLYKLAYEIKPGDKNKYISDTIRMAEEPTVIYSSGVNNLMREVGNNPFAIKSDYINREKRENYNYTLEKASDDKVLNSVIDGIKRNYESILTINDKTDIYTLGAYVPKSLQSEEMNVFRDIIIRYNEALINLCKEYNAIFIDTENVGKEFNKSDFNFHITTTGHNMLANYILKCMYEKKIINSSTDLSNKFEFEVTNSGVNGIIQDIMREYDSSMVEADTLDGYARSRQLKIANEHLREADVFKKVLKKTKR